MAASAFGITRRRIAHAPENAAMFGDDMQFERAFKELDPADRATFPTRFCD